HAGHVMRSPYREPATTPGSIDGPFRSPRAVPTIQWAMQGARAMARRQPTGEDHDGPRAVPSSAPGRAPARALTMIDDPSLLDLVPHPVFVVEIEAEEQFQFTYVNDAYRELLGDDHGTGDLRGIVPAHALVAHIRAFAEAAMTGQHVAFEADWGPSASRR